MKTSIYASGDNPPFWNIVFEHMTLDELNGVISFSSTIMNAARKAKLKIKDEDPLQQKIDFDDLSVSDNSDDEKIKQEIKKKIRDEADKKKEAMRMIDPYFGLKKKNKDFLALLHYNFYDSEVEIYGEEYSNLLKENKMSRGSFNTVLRNLADRKHVSIKELSDSKHTLVSFILNGPYF